MHMRSRLVAVVVLVSLLTGCAAVREVDLDVGGSRLAEVNAAAKGKSASVELVSGKTHSGLKFDLGPDTTCWTEGGRWWMRGGDEERVCVPTSEVHKITVHRRLKGCLVGGGTGLGVAGAGVVIPAIAMGPIGQEMDGGLVLIYLGAIGVVVGTVVGTVVGVAKGKDVYVLNP